MLDLVNRTVEVEPALPPLVDGSEFDSSDSYNHIQKLPEESRMAKYQLPYDKLVISVGCYSADFGIPGVSKYGNFLKDIKDARNIRRRIL